MIRLLSDEVASLRIDLDELRARASSHGVVTAMLGFRYMAAEVRDYYACLVGGLQRSANTRLDPNDLSKFLADVQPHQPKNPDLEQRLKRSLSNDRQNFTWDELCNFIEFVDTTIAQSQVCSNRPSLQRFLETPDLNISVSGRGITKANVKRIASAFVDAYDSLDL